MPTTETRARTELYRRATENWEYLKKTHRESWAKYKEIGEAMVDARAEIMRKHGLNQPAGPGYQKDIMGWLVEHKLDDMHKTTRSHLCELIDHIDEVKLMMDGDGTDANKGWSLTERMEWNAPNTVHRKWQAWRRKQGHTSEGQRKRLNTAKQTSDQLAIALERIHELEQEVQLKDERIDQMVKSGKSPTVATNKNPLIGYDHGKIVDFILELKASTVKAIAHDLARETATNKKPEAEDPPAPILRNKLKGVKLGRLRPPPRKNRQQAEAAKLDLLFDWINAKLVANGDPRRLTRLTTPLGTAYALKGPPKADGKQDTEGGLQHADLVRLGKELKVLIDDPTVRAEQPDDAPQPTKSKGSSGSKTARTAPTLEFSDIPVEVKGKLGYEAEIENGKRCLRIEQIVEDGWCIMLLPTSRPGDDDHQIDGDYPSREAAEAVAQRYFARHPKLWGKS